MKKKKDGRKCAVVSGNVKSVGGDTSSFSPLSTATPVSSEKKILTFSPPFSSSPFPSTCNIAANKNANSNSVVDDKKTNRNSLSAVSFAPPSSPRVFISSPSPRSSRQSHINDYFPITPIRASASKDRNKKNNNNTQDEKKEKNCNEFEKKKSRKSLPASMNVAKEDNVFCSTIPFSPAKISSCKNSPIKNVFSFVNKNTTSPAFLRTPRTYRKRRRFSDNSEEEKKEKEKENENNENVSDNNNNNNSNCNNNHNNKNDGGKKKQNNKNKNSVKRIKDSKSISSSITVSPAPLSQDIKRQPPSDISPHFPKLLSPIDRRMISTTPKKRLKSEESAMPSSSSRVSSPLSSSVIPPPLSVSSRPPLSSLSPLPSSSSIPPSICTPPPACKFPFSSLKFPFSSNQLTSPSIFSAAAFHKNSHQNEEEKQNKEEEEEEEEEKKKKVFSSFSSTLHFTKDGISSTKTPKKTSNSTRKFGEEKVEEKKNEKEEEEEEEEEKDEEEKDSSTANKKINNLKKEEKNNLIEEFELTKSLISYPQNPMEMIILSDGALRLPIGFEFKKLLQFYKCLSTVIDRHLGKGTPLLFFTNLKGPVEQLMQSKRFSLEKLQQMLWICPYIFDLKYVNLKEKIDDNFDYELILLDHRDGKRIEQCLSWEETEEREKVFLSCIIRWIDWHHEASLKNLKTPRKDLSNWHPQFNIDSIASVPLKKLPEKRNRSRSPSLVAGRSPLRCEILSSLKTSTKLSPISTQNFPPFSRMPSPPPAPHPSPSSAFSSPYNSYEKINMSVWTPPKSSNNNNNNDGLRNITFPLSSLGIYNNDSNTNSRAVSPSLPSPPPCSPCTPPLSSSFVDVHSPVLSSSSSCVRTRTPIRYMSSMMGGGRGGCVSHSSLSPVLHSPVLRACPSSPLILPAAYPLPPPPPPSVSSVSPFHLSPAQMSPLMQASSSPSSPILHRTPNSSRMHSPALQRIQYKEEQKQKAMMVEKTLREKENKVYAKLSYWEDVKWVLEKLIDMHANSARAVIQQIPLLVKRIAATFQDRLITPDRIERALYELASQIPQAVQLSDSLCDKNVKCLKFNANFEIGVAIQEISKKYKESENEYRSLMNEKNTQIIEHFAALNEENKNDEKNIAIINNNNLTPVKHNTLLSSSLKTRHSSSSPPPPPPNTTTKYRRRSSISNERIQKNKKQNFVLNDEKNELVE